MILNENVSNPYIQKLQEYKFKKIGNLNIGHIIGNFDRKKFDQLATLNFSGICKTDCILLEIDPQIFKIL